MLEIPIACQELLGNTARLVLWKMDVSSKHTRQHRKPDSARSGTRSFSFPTSLEPRPTASVSWLLRASPKSLHHRFRAVLNLTPATQRKRGSEIKRENATKGQHAMAVATLAKGNDYPA
ncbi:hypothetical protein C0Q70_11114 [Pomacea canaliculata]|uniref:Uncharacterized protein n=1 Tax=Pomacea canaliculata TaxID=400727 RepID=A0A2T7P550_POMCA|nr:hypothetical protein C0Q70_11114 [Pomacea canaliculata]